MTDVPAKKEKKPRVRLGANYWKLWSSSVVSNLGDGVAMIAYPGSPRRSRATLC
jgi:hypothetical protein